MSVAESTEILRPITQLGCAQASSGVTRSRRARSASRNGPPDAVSRIFFTPGGASPQRVFGGRHWNTALCSLSMGSSVAPALRTICMSSGPAITSDSLLANNNRLPARAAASVERNPAAPTMAAITLSTSGSAAISTMPSTPPITCVGALRARNSPSRRAAAARPRARRMAR